LHLPPACIRTLDDSILAVPAKCLPTSIGGSVIVVEERDVRLVIYDAVLLQMTNVNHVASDNHLEYHLGEPMRKTLVNEQGSNADGRRNTSLRLEHLGALERIVRDYGFKDRSHFFQICTDALIKAHGDSHRRLDWPPRFVLRD
jgi:hypothetical protein